MKGSLKSSIVWAGIIPTPFDQDPWPATGKKKEPVTRVCQQDSGQILPRTTSFTGRILQISRFFVIVFKCILQKTLQNDSLKGAKSTSLRPECASSSSMLRRYLFFLRCAERASLGGSLDLMAFSGWAGALGLETRQTWVALSLDWTHFLAVAQVQSFC